MANVPDLHSWDTVFAIRTDVVNGALATLPPSQEYTYTKPIGGNRSATLKWKLGNWRITDTPGGSSLKVTLDFASGSKLSVTDEADVALDGWSCDVVFRAHFEELDATTSRLVAKTASGDWVESVTVKLPPTTPDPPPPALADARDLVGALVVEWFDQPSPSDAVDLFALEFAVVDLGADVSAANLPWLKPIVLGFAGNTMSDGKTKALGILAMTPHADARDPVADAKARASAAGLELSPFALPANAKAGFLISGPLILRNWLMPSVAGAFGGNPNDPTATFTVSNGNQLVNTGDLEFTQEFDGNTRKANLARNQLTFWFSDDTLRMKIDSMKVESSYAFIKLSMSVDQAYTASVGDVGGKPVFLLSSFEKAAPSVSIDPDARVEVATNVANFLVVAGLAFLAVKTPKGLLAKMPRFQQDPNGAKLWARLICAGLGVGTTLLLQTPNFMLLTERLKDHDLPDFKLLINAGLKKITWPGQTETKFHPTQAAFASALHVTIDPTV